MDAASVAGGAPVSSMPARHAGVLVVSDVRLLREGLVEWLEAEQNIAGVAEAEGADEALARLYRPPPPLVVLIDAGLPWALVLVRLLLGIDPRVRCLPFGIDDRPGAASSWLAAGAAGVVRRSASRGELAGILGIVLRSGGLGPPHEEARAGQRAGAATAGARRPAPTPPLLTCRRSTPGAATRRSPAASGSSRQP